MERYEPPSDFLKLVASDEVPLSGGVPAAANLARLVAMTMDGDDANRDWAVFLLARSGIDGERARVVLTRAAADPVTAIRDEAMVLALSAWLEPSSADLVDRAAERAFAACRKSTPTAGEE